MVFRCGHIVLPGCRASRSRAGYHFRWGGCRFESCPPGATRVCSSIGRAPKPGAHPHIRPAPGSMKPSPTTTPYPHGRSPRMPTSAPSGGRVERGERSAMARDPLAAVSTVSTPQTQRIPGRIDQVRNNAGGYVFGKDLWTKLEDFLILGTTGGTYYLREDRLTEANVDVLLQAIQEDGPRVVLLVTDISAARPPRAPKNRPAVFALAAAFAYGNPATVQAAKGAFTEVVRTTDHLSMFFGYDKQLEGKPTPQGTAPVTGRAVGCARVMVPGPGCEPGRVEGVQGTPADHPCEGGIRVAGRPAHRPPEGRHPAAPGAARVAGRERHR